MDVTSQGTGLAISGLALLVSAIPVVRGATRKQRIRSRVKADLELLILAEQGKLPSNITNTVRARALDDLVTLAVLHRPGYRPTKHEVGALTALILGTLGAATYAVFAFSKAKPFWPWFIFIAIQASGSIWLRRINKRNQTKLKEEKT